MRLHSLHLVNFRQHSDTFVEFRTGLTGIIGPNGSGKSTLLEAIAWALYGNSAARGTKDTIRRLSAGEGRVPVRVELRFELAGHRYHVVRSLSNAECFLDDSATAVATTVKGVSEFMQQRLGMTRSEFFHTYFTGQKELDVMSTLSPLERARFLSRVLGYDRITAAQELVRERRKVLAAELNGLRQGMGDGGAIELAVRAAREQLSECETLLLQATKDRDAAALMVKRAEPQWQEAQMARERFQTLDAERRIAEAEAASKKVDEGRISMELEALEETSKALLTLQTEVASLGEVKGALQAMEKLGNAMLRRKDWLDSERREREEHTRLLERASQLAQASALEADTSNKVLALREQVGQVERDLESQRTAWTRDRQEVETKLEALRKQYAELSEQRSLLEGLGADSPCPTCGRPLGEGFREVLEQVQQQLETVRVDGQYYRQRSEQLAAAPTSVTSLTTTRQQLQADLQQSERKLQRIEAALLEAKSIASQLVSIEERLAHVTHELSLLPEGYDPESHQVLKEKAARLNSLERQIARSEAQLERRVALRKELDQVKASAGAVNDRLKSLLIQAGEAAQVADSAPYAAARENYEKAVEGAHQSAILMSTLEARAEQAKIQMSSALEAEQEFKKRKAVADGLDTEHRLHDELDRAFADIRTDLNADLRPELADTASVLLAELTDGRYKNLEFDDDYRLLVLEDEVRKPVLSGGEEDLCNLVLRLAISQMIAERAGQAFSLLILDEVFGSLDESRRSSVIDLLRHLHDRFEQVIVITHIEQVREGLDQVIQVEFDETQRASVVKVVQ